MELRKVRCEVTPSAHTGEIHSDAVSGVLYSGIVMSEFIQVADLDRYSYVIPKARGGTHFVR